jgi:hypothetical protein
MHCTVQHQPTTHAQVSSASNNNKKCKRKIANTGRILFFFGSLFQQYRIGSPLCGNPAEQSKDAHVWKKK